jgi:predicted nuclease with TOPRIM domain
MDKWKPKIIIPQHLLDEYNELRELGQELADLKAERITDYHKYEDLLEKYYDLKAEHEELQQHCKEIWKIGVEKDRQLGTLKQLVGEYYDAMGKHPNDADQWGLLEKLKQALEQ